MGPRNHLLDRGTDALIKGQLGDKCHPVVMDGNYVTQHSKGNGSTTGEGGMGHNRAATGKGNSGQG